MIWLLRHGEAEDGSPDAERKLTDKGEQQSRHAGAALKRLGVELDACLTSHKARALDTAPLLHRLAVERGGGTPSSKVRALDTARLGCKSLGIEPVLEPRLEGGPFD